MTQQQQDDAVLGLCLGLLVFASIPITSAAAMWLGLLFLIIVWGQATGHVPLPATQTATLSGVPAPQGNTA